MRSHHVGVLNLRFVRSLLLSKFSLDLETEVWSSLGFSLRRTGRKGLGFRIRRGPAEVHELGLQCFVNLSRLEQTSSCRFMHSCRHEYHDQYNIRAWRKHACIHTYMHTYIRKCLRVSGHRRPEVAARLACIRRVVKAIFEFVD